MKWIVTKGAQALERGNAIGGDLLPSGRELPYEFRVLNEVGVPTLVGRCDRQPQVDDLSMLEANFAQCRKVGAHVWENIQ
jgi:hypothetical protein